MVNDIVEYSNECQIHSVFLRIIGCAVILPILIDSIGIFTIFVFLSIYQNLIYLLMSYLLILKSTDIY